MQILYDCMCRKASSLEGSELANIPYYEVKLQLSYSELNIDHDTQKGLKKLKQKKIKVFLRIRSYFAAIKSRI